jgi:hypothetical protein
MKVIHGTEAVCRAKADRLFTGEQAVFVKPFRARHGAGVAALVAADQDETRGQGV